MAIYKRTSDDIIERLNKIEKRQMKVGHASELQGLHADSFTYDEIHEDKDWSLNIEADEAMTFIKCKQWILNAIICDSNGNTIGEVKDIKILPNGRLQILSNKQGFQTKVINREEKDNG